MRHPYYDYTLEEALRLALNIKKDRLIRQHKTRSANQLATIKPKEALEIMKTEVKATTFNWITGQVALQLLEHACGLREEFTL